VHIWALQNTNARVQIQIFQIHDHFRHTFSSIGPTGAEIWPFKDLSKIWSFSDAIDKDKELGAAKSLFEKVFNSLPKMAAPVPVSTLVSSFCGQ
jgi:hypothetical protein